MCLSWAIAAIFLNTLSKVSTLKSTVFESHLALKMLVKLRVKKYLIFLFLILPTFVFAEVRLIVLQTDHSSPRIILPQLETETSTAAVERYFRNILNNDELKKIAQPIENLQIQSVQNLSAENQSGKVRLAFIANWFQDMTSTGDRIQRNLKTFTKAGADTYVIGLSADLGLSDKDALDYRNEVVKNFSLLVSLGGDDISPELYGEEKTFARNLNLTRDRSELKLVQYFKQKARGIFFGICRGHQMGAVADGHKLHQDLSKTGTGDTDYHINLSGKNSSEMQTWHGIDIQKSLLSRFLNGTEQLFVNSVHHQAVKINSAASSEAVAYDDKNRIVEALQGKNNKSVSVQFHPEFPAEISGNSQFSESGFEIIKGIVRYARLHRQKNSTNQCGKLFQ